jgi:arylsulfatase A-like enzyme
MYRFSFLASPILFAFWLASLSSALGGVNVDFGHSFTGAPGATQNTGDVTLNFTVDDTGRVSLDASSQAPDAARFVDEWDGPVGTATDPGMRGKSFSMTLSSTGPGTLRIDNTGSGLAIQGGNSQLIDANKAAGKEELTAAITVSGSQFSLAGVHYANLAGNAELEVSGNRYPLAKDSGTVDVSGQGVTETFTVTSTGSKAGQGFVLSGFTFDLTEAPTTSDVVVRFANSGTGFGSPTDARTIPWVSAGGPDKTITLDFSINKNGVVSLKASTDSTTPLFKNMVAEWSNAAIGSVTDPALQNQSFSLTGTGTGGTGGLTITEKNGGGIGVLGENSNRVDGLNYGEDSTTSKPETLAWTLTAPKGMVLNLVNWSYVDGADGDVEVAASGKKNKFTDLTGAVDTTSLTGLSLSNRDSLTFREIPDAGPTTGAAIAGFTFSIASVATDLGFNNANGDGLWTTPGNWKPEGVPTAPTDAIIDGYDIVIDTTVAESPAALEIADGSLTLSKNGRLTVSSMNIGKVLESAVRLTLKGSLASLNHTGSGTFTVGSSATVESVPDNNGSSPLELDNGSLVLEAGYEWILDGRDYTGTVSLGDRFLLANFGSLSGPGFGSDSEDGFSDTAGFRTRNFDLPPDRRLQLVKTANSIYYEVVAQPAAAGPNIIVINVDDMAGGQHFHFEGRDAISPTLDSLASGGIRFTTASAASTVCGASRYALMTSRYPSRNTSKQFLARYPLGTIGRFGVSDTELESDNQNIAAWLQQAGYRTGMVGKGHLIDDDLTQTRNWAAKGLLTYPKSADPKSDPITNAKMRHNHRVLCQRMRAFGFDYVNSYYKANLKELYNDSCDVHNQEWITKGALDFIEENHGERFFLYMAPTINHGPVRNDLSKTLKADPCYTGAGYLPNEDYSFMPTRKAIIDEVTTGEKELISARETWLDYSIKAIINKLTAHGIRNDTLIIFTSDHGEKDLNSSRPGQGPVIWGKSSLYELGMRVPLVMNWPNGINSPGRTYNEIVSHVDIAPTLLALNGASALPTRPVDGVSLVPVLNGGSTAVRQDLFAEIGYARAVRTKDRKYIEVRYPEEIYAQIDSGYKWERVEGNHATGEHTEPRPYYTNNRQLGSLAANSNPTYFDDDQLYDLSQDQAEDTNIYDQEPAATEVLKKRLAEYLQDFPDRPFREFSERPRDHAPIQGASPPSKSL